MARHEQGLHLVGEVLQVQDGPGLTLLVGLEGDVGDHDAQAHLVAVLDPAGGGRLLEGGDGADGVDLEGVLELLQGMARDVEAQGLPLVEEPLLAGPEIHVLGQGPVVGEAGHLGLVEQGGHALVGKPLPRVLHGRRQAREQGGPVRLHAVEGAGLDQGLPDAAVGLLQVRGLEGMEEILEAPFGLAGGEDGLQGGLAQPLHGGKAEADLPGAGDGEIQVAAVDVGTQDLEVELLAVLDVLDHVIGATGFGREQTGHELGEVIGLQKRGLVRDEGVGSRMAVVHDQSIGHEVVVDGYGQVIGFLDAQRDDGPDLFPEDIRFGMGREFFALEYRSQPGQGAAPEALLHGIAVANELLHGKAAEDFHILPGQPLGSPGISHVAAHRCGHGVHTGQAALRGLHVGAKDFHLTFPAQQVRTQPVEEMRKGSFAEDVDTVADPVPPSVFEQLLVDPAEDPQAQEEHLDVHRQPMGGGGVVGDLQVGVPQRAVSRPKPPEKQSQVLVPEGEDLGWNAFGVRFQAQDAKFLGPMVHAAPAMPVAGLPCLVPGVLPGAHTDFKTAILPLSDAGLGSRK